MLGKVFEEEIGVELGDDVYVQCIDNINSFENICKFVKLCIFYV